VAHNSPYNASNAQNRSDRRHRVGRYRGAGNRQVDNETGLDAAVREDNLRIWICRDEAFASTLVRRIVVFVALHPSNLGRKPVAFFLTYRDAYHEPMLEMMTMTRTSRWGSTTAPSPHSV
jgi:hypothetical protein